MPRRPLEPLPLTGGLPRHVRGGAKFSDVFDRRADHALAAMDAHGDDIASQTPSVHVGLQHVGVERRSIPVTIADPFGADGVVQIPCAVSVTVALDPDRRGIHVSRVGDLLATRTGDTFASLVDYADALLIDMLSAQACSSGTVRVSGVLSYLEDVASVRPRASLEHLDVIGEAAAASGRRRRTVGLAFRHLTACPCVQQTLEHATGATHDPAAPTLPLLTHSQRCTTRVTIESDATTLSIADLLQAVDQVVVRTQNTLPRDAELLAVFAAHARAQFVEDVVRDLVRAVWLRLPDALDSTTIAVESRSEESIHDFDLVASTRHTAGDLRRWLATSTSAATS